MPLAAFFVQANPPALAALVVVFNSHAGCRTHAGEGVAHRAQDGAVTEPDDRASVDGVEQLPRLVRFEHWGLTDLNHMLGTAN